MSRITNSLHALARGCQPPLPTSWCEPLAGPSGYRRHVSGWAAVAVGAAVLAAAAVREAVRWRGRRWQRSGPRGDRDGPDRQD